MDTKAKNKSPIISEAYNRMSLYSLKLYRRGISLRLLAALMGTSNYGTVYGHLIAHDKSMMRVSRSRPPEWERALYKQWELAFPAELAAMEEKCISLRQWCCYHDIVTSAMGAADIPSMLDKAAGSDIHDKDIQGILNEDFPSLQASRKVYWAKEVDPDLHYWLDEVYPNGRKRYMYFTHVRTSVTQV